MRGAIPADRLRRLSALKLPVALAAFAAITAVTVAIADLRMFTGFASYDDEGYMLIALKVFLHHGHLYNDVFSQYGPFYYEFWGAFFEIFGLSVNHDGGRAAAIVAWVLASLLFGLAMWRMTRSALLGLATQILVFVAIGTVTNEPMHPGGIICLLLGVIVALSCLVRARPSPLAIALLGGAVTALILVKVNVGGFALAALALVCVVSYPFGERQRWLRPAVEFAFIAVPFLLITSKLGESWARHYAAHVSLAALALVLALRALRPPRRSDEELRWLLGGLLATAVVLCLAIVAAGTTPGGLVEGVITQPLRQTDAFTLPLALDGRTYIFDLLGVAGAAALWYFAREGRRPADPALVSLVAAASIVLGLSMALSTIGRTPFFVITTFPGYQFAFLPFAWVGLISFAAGSDGDTAFARLLLPPLAVLAALHAYPVAGSQVQWSVFLLIPVGALCVAGGVRALAQTLSDARGRRAVGAAAALAATVLFTVIVNTQLRQLLDNSRAAYNAAVPLDLPGAEEVRLGRSEADLYRKITRAIDANCGPLLTLPGMNSFYIWSQREPPTGYNATAWLTLFDDAHEERVIRETRSIKGLCLLENEGQALGWTAGVPPHGPLVRYLHEGFRPLFELSGYRLLRREGTGRASS
ncbi:MAG: hypothetical protein ACM3JL_01630 [Nitrososphaerota archaeon]